MVGTSGKRSDHCSLVTAIALSLPPLIRPITVGVLNRPIATSPLATAWMAAGVASLLMLIWTASVSLAHDHERARRSRSGRPRAPPTERPAGQAGGAGGRR